MDSPLKEFLLVSADFLKLMAAKPNGYEKDTLESFYDRSRAIVQNAELVMHAAKLEKINEHAKAKIMEAELKKIYNYLYMKFPTHAMELIKESSLPTRKELDAPLILK